MDGTPHNFSSNKEFTIEILKYLILNMFPNLNQIQVEKFSIEFFNNCDDYKIFKSSVRDLMISSRSFSSQENEFYMYEMKKEKDKAI